MNFKYLIFFIAIISLNSCGTSESLPVAKYYNYDKTLPLYDTVKLISKKNTYDLYQVEYRSIHDKVVSALLSLPNNTTKEQVPIIILLHGLGDSKTVDYIEFGNDFFTKNGYAVLRIDIHNHGDRIEHEYEMDFTGKSKYWTRNIISQTVFDLRRAIDFIYTREDIDHQRIGFYGISLGGITGTIFCGVEDRVKVPVIVIAGGQLNLLFGTKALSQEAKDYTSIIEPLNFIKQISPRPLLMINAENDEVVPPMMTKILYKSAKEPKNIIWYPTRHHDIPQKKVFQDGVDWYQKYL